MVSYIDTIALRIHHHNDPYDNLEPHDWPLYRIYAVLALAKGEATTARDVHDAWAAWAVEHRSFSKNIIPFDELTPEVQAMDNQYVAAIHAVSREQEPSQ